MRICITKFKDNTYIISNGKVLKGPFKFHMTVATAYWFYKLDKVQVNNAVADMVIKNHDIAIFEYDSVRTEKLSNIYKNNDLGE
jgi:hypothetical protein